jgi:hypothetical protein
MAKKSLFFRGNLGLWNPDWNGCLSLTCAHWTNETLLLGFYQIKREPNGCRMLSLHLRNESGRIRTFHSLSDPLLPYLASQERQSHQRNACPQICYAEPSQWLHFPHYAHRTGWQWGPSLIPSVIKLACLSSPPLVESLGQREWRNQNRPSTSTTISINRHWNDSFLVPIPKFPDPSLRKIERLAASSLEMSDIEPSTLQKGSAHSEVVSRKSRAAELHPRISQRYSVDPRVCSDG